MVDLGSLVHLKHVASSYWLHCPTPNSKGHQMQLYVSKEQQEADVFRFEAADEPMVHDLLYAKNCIDELTAFLKQSISASLERKHDPQIITKKEAPSQVITRLPAHTTKIEKDPSHFLLKNSFLVLVPPSLD